jgi:hypothetical protein
VTDLRVLEYERLIWVVVGESYTSELTELSWAPHAYIVSPDAFQDGLPSEATAEPSEMPIRATRLAVLLLVVPVNVSLNQLLPNAVTVLLTLVKLNAVLVKACVEKLSVTEQDWEDAPRKEIYA